MKKIMLLLVLASLVFVACPNTPDNGDEDEVTLSALKDIQGVLYSAYEPCYFPELTPENGEYSSAYDNGYQSETFSFTAVNYLAIKANATNNGDTLKFSLSPLSLVDGATSLASVPFPDDYDTESIVVVQGLKMDYVVSEGKLIVTGKTDNADYPGVEIKFPLAGTIDATDGVFEFTYEDLSSAE